MLNFMSNFNATKKISITSVLFSLLILFFSLNGGFCTNFCSATYKEDANEYSILEKSNRWDSNGNEEEGENDNILFKTNRNSKKSEFFIEGSDEDDQNNSVDVNDFVNTSVKVDQSGKISSTKHTYNGKNNRVTFNMVENNNNEEEAKNDASGSEDYKEYSPSGEGNDENSQPDVPKSRYGDLCPSFLRCKIC